MKYCGMSGPFAYAKAMSLTNIDRLRYYILVYGRTLKGSTSLQTSSHRPVFFFSIDYNASIAQTRKLHREIYSIIYSTYYMYLLKENCYSINFHKRKGGCRQNSNFPLSTMCRDICRGKERE